MSDDAIDPIVVPVPAQKPVDRRVVMWLGIGSAVGLAIGVLLTIGAYSTYNLITETLPSTRDQVLVFNELNELRQQINELNDAKKAKELEAAEALQKLSVVASKVP